jgi:hypothetical protein
MTHRPWWYGGLVSLLLLVGAVGGCGDGDHDDGFPESAVCLLIGEREPNATPLTAQILDDVFIGDCFVVEGSLFDRADVDSYRVFIQETLTVVVTLEHSPLVDFDVQLFDADTGQLILDCGIDVGPESCVVPFVVRGFDIAVDVVVTSFSGAGTYTLTLDAR